MGTTRPVDGDNRQHHRRRVRRDADAAVQMAPGRGEELQSDVGDIIGPAARSAKVLEQGLPALDFLAAGGDPEVVEPWFDGRFYNAKPKGRIAYLAAVDHHTCEKEVKKASVKEPFDSPFAGLAQMLKRS